MSQLFRLFGVRRLLAAGLLACAGPAQAGGTGVRPLPPALAALLPTQEVTDPAADVRRLEAARPRWRADPLGRLLVLARLGHDYYRLRQDDSCHYYLLRAWHLATPALRRRQPAEVINVANGLALYFYGTGAADSTYYYFQQAFQLFRAARLDSTRNFNQGLPSSVPWGGGGTLAGSLANAGSASRALGDVPRALRLIEQAAALYRALGLANGLVWAQSLLGETYAAQDNAAQAQLAYGQAYRTARELLAVNQHDGSFAMAGVLLDYYAPLLLTQPGQAARLARLAAEVRQELLRNARPAGNLAGLRPDIVNPLVRLDLLLAQAALQANQPAAAQPWLASTRQWLRLAARTGLAREHDTFYPELQADYLGLLAWQRRATDPAAARLLAQAVALVERGDSSSPQRQNRLLLARCCVLMREPGWAVRLLRPLLPTYQRSGATWPLSQVTSLLTQAYAQAGRFDSAYYFSRRTQGLLDTVREGRQFAALAATEARFRTREQAGRIRLLTRLDEQHTRYARLAGLGAGLLALLALALGLAWRKTQRLNQQLAAQAAQLGELDAAKNQFFANVSHELRTPLTLVLGPLDSLLAGPTPLLPAVRQPVALAHAQAQRLARLVNRILDLTKLRAGWLDLRPVPTPLAALLRRVVGQFDSLAAQRGVALHLPAALPDALCLLLDAGKVEEILTNLLGNALKHTPAGGTVRVRLELPAGPAGLYALTVADTGPGIAEAEQARVFERFYQTPQGQAQGGTGLGLALSHELAQLLGGSLTLVSTPGQGAAFTLTFAAEEVPALPAAEAPAELRPAPLPAPAAGPRPRVLVVEDQPDMRDYLAGLLAPACEVLLAPDGQAALELLAQAAPPIDLLTTDAMMPRLSGTELLARLRAIPSLARMPVLMLTARADEVHRLQALTVGVDDYLTKPFVPAELLARVRVLLARQQVRRHFAALPPAEEPAPAPAPRPAPADPAAPVAAPATTTRRRLAPTPPQQLDQWQALAATRLADERFGPTELADLLCLSERTLYRRLGELAGLTPAAWLRELRLDKARQLLEAGDFASVAAVADAVGFASAKYFASVYAERFGRRPSEYGG